MVSKKNIFDKLSLKKKMELNKQHQISNHLTNESNNNSDSKINELGILNSYEFLIRNTNSENKNTNSNK